MSGKILNTHPIAEKAAKKTSSITFIHLNDPDASIRENSQKQNTHFKINFIGIVTTILYVIVSESINLETVIGRHILGYFITDIF